MTEIDAYQKLAPYFDALIDYTDPDEKFDELVKRSESLREKLRQKFGLDSIVKTPGNYSKCFSLEVYFDENCSPINPRAAIEDFTYRFRIKFDISAIAPFCTYSIRLSPLHTEEILVTNSFAPRSSSNELLWLLADDCINWLCGTESIDYIPFEALQKEVPERFDLGSLSESTLYSIIFTEE
jgi:hypothetical protein